MGIQNAKFYADSKSENEIWKECTIKKLLEKNYQKSLQLQHIVRGQYVIVRGRTCTWLF